jgi:hypothetical protein
MNVTAATSLNGCVDRAGYSAARRDASPYPPAVQLLKVEAGADGEVEIEIGVGHEIKG